ncbi:MAG: thioredoxin family protein [Rikenellaceae bacterium]|nr:thioredoxin family protein [Rikenellaceae bacterium]
MKKTLIALTLALAVSGTMHAQNKGTQFIEGTLDEALATAGSGNGPSTVFVDCYASWCGPCRFMSSMVFPKEEVGRFFNEHFVNVRIDMEKDGGDQIKKQYGVNAYPTFLILNADGSEINRLVGGAPADQFVEMVRKAMDPGNSLAALKAAYERESTTENAINYLETLKNAKKDAELTLLMEEVFPTLSDYERFSERMWPIVAASVTSPESPTLDYIIENKPLANLFVGEDKVNELLKSVYGNYLTGVLNGRIEVPKRTVTDKAVLVINMLDLPIYDPLVVLSRLAAAKADADYDKIIFILENDVAHMPVYPHRTIYEKAITLIKDFTPKQREQIARYFERSAERYTKAADEAKENMRAVGK